MLSAKCVRRQMCHKSAYSGTYKDTLLKMQCELRQMCLRSCCLGAYGEALKDSVILLVDLESLVVIKSFREKESERASERESERDTSRRPRESRCGASRAATRSASP
jgi:hypothetical protein